MGKRMRVYKQAKTHYFSELALEASVSIVTQSKHTIQLQSSIIQHFIILRDRKMRRDPFADNPSLSFESNEPLQTTKKKTIEKTSEVLQ